MKQSVWIVSIYETHHDGQTIIDSIWSSEGMAQERIARLKKERRDSPMWRMSCDEYELDPIDGEQT